MTNSESQRVSPLFKDHELVEKYQMPLEKQPLAEQIMGAITDRHLRNLFDLKQYISFAFFQELLTKAWKNYLINRYINDWQKHETSSHPLDDLFIKIQEDRQNENEAKGDSDEWDLYDFEEESDKPKYKEPSNGKNDPELINRMVLSIKTNTPEELKRKIKHFPSLHKQKQLFKQWQNTKGELIKHIDQEIDAEREKWELIKMDFHRPSRTEVEISEKSLDEYKKIIFKITNQLFSKIIKRQSDSVRSAEKVNRRKNFFLLHEQLKSVGGDDIRIETKKDGSFTGKLIDHTGHGWQAALYREILESELKKRKPRLKISDISTIDQITGEKIGHRPLPCSFFHLDQTSGNLTFCNAGIISCIIKKNGTVELHENSEVENGNKTKVIGVWVGAEKTRNFSTVQVQLNPGDIMLVCSDGFFERSNVVKTGGLAQFFHKQNIKNLSDLEKIIASELRSEISEKFPDDVTIFAHQYKP